MFKKFNKIKQRYLRNISLCLHFLLLLKLIQYLHLLHFQHLLLFPTCYTTLLSSTSTIYCVWQFIARPVCTWKSPDPCSSIWQFSRLDKTEFSLKEEGSWQHYKGNIWYFQTNISLSEFVVHLLEALNLSTNRHLALSGHHQNLR